MKSSQAVRRYLPDDASRERYRPIKTAPALPTGLGRPANIVVLGASTGGPKTLAAILSGLPKLNACVILVQHMPKFINESFRRTLDKLTDMDVAIAEEGHLLENGKLYVAPSEVQLQIADNRRITLSDRQKVNYVCPSIDVTMKSLERKPANRVIGVLLTGMGKDGADGIAHIKRIGGTTMAQDEKTSTVYGMPKAAVATGNVDYVLSPQGIRDKLVELVN